MRDHDVTPLKQIGKNSMQMSFGLFWLLVVDLADLKESVENAFLVDSF